MLGIGRARVHQFEKSAMRKLRKWLKPYLPQNDSDDDGPEIPKELRIVREPTQVSHSAQHGWLKVSRIAGNEVFPPEVVCFVFNELRLLHEKAYRPPLIVGNFSGYASAAAMEGDTLLVRAWLAGGAVRALGNLGNYQFELSVQILQGIPVVQTGTATVSRGPKTGQ
jgi:hypothetical protein